MYLYIVTYQSEEVKYFDRQLLSYINNQQYLNPRCSTDKTENKLLY